MAFSLGQPALAPLAALAAAPVLVHLFARRRPTDTLFSSLRFLKHTMREHARVQRPRHWILLTARTLAILLLAAIFMDLRWRPQNAAPPAPELRRHVVVIVDSSASMAWSEGGQTRFAAAVEDADRIISDLAPGDLANVVWLDSSPEAVWPEPGIDRAALRDTLRRGRVSQTAGDLRAALAIAQRQLEGAGGGEIVLVSDFQATGWPESLPPAPPGITLQAVRVGGGDATNLAITSIASTPARPLAGETLTVSAEVANFTPAAHRVAVLLEAGGARQTREVDVAPWSRTSAVFALPSAPEGVLPITVSLPPDNFHADDSRQCVVSVRARLRCVTSGSDTETLQAWERALGALGWAQVERGAPGDDIDADAWLVAGWDGRGAAALSQALHDGATVLVLPAAGLPVDTWAGLGLAGGGPASATPASSGDRWTWTHLGADTRLTLPHGDDHLFDAFGQGAFGDPAEALVRTLATAPANQTTLGDVLVATAAGTPVIVRRTVGAGMLYLWAAPLAAQDGDWAGRGTFVPLVAEMFLSARGASRSATAPESIEAGTLPAWQPPRGVPRGDISFTRNEGALLPLAATDASAPASAAPAVSPQAPLVLAADAPEPGLYQWRVRGSAMRWVAVNFPSIESDLRTREPPASLAVTPTTSAGDVRARHEGVPLWPWLLAALGGLLIGEGGFAAWLGRK